MKVMSKRFLAFVLVISMLTGLAGCGVAGPVAERLKQNRSNRENPESVEAETTVPSVTMQPQKPVTEETSLPEETPAATPSTSEDVKAGSYGPEVKPVSYTLSRYGESDADEDTGIVLSKYSRMEIEVDPSYPKLFQSIEEYNRETKEQIDDEYATLKAYGREDREYIKSIHEDEPWYFFRAEHYVTVERADEHYFTFVETMFEDLDGSHGNTLFRSYNYDTQTGELLDTDSFFKRDRKLTDFIAGDLVDKYGYDAFLEVFDDTSGEAAKSLSDLLFEYYIKEDHEYDLAAVIGYDGIILYFSPYEICSYSRGMQSAYLSYDKCGQYFNIKNSDIPSCYMETVRSDTLAEYYFTTSDGERESLKIQDIVASNPDVPDLYEINKVEIRCGDVAYPWEVYGFAENSYFVKYYDKSYLFVEIIGENDYVTVQVFELDKNLIRPLDTFNPKKTYGRPQLGDVTGEIKDFKAIWH